MAARLDVVDKSLKDLKKEVTCGVCQEYFTDPKFLPCLHYYCKECVLGLAQRTGNNKPFSCPECHKSTTLPEGGVEGLKSAFFINRLWLIYEKHKKAVSKQAHCEICIPEALAEAFCQQCNKFACKNCVHMHSTMKTMFVGHEMVPLDQLQNVKAEELVPQKSASPSCQVHGDPLKIFCLECSKLICPDCSLKDHRDHYFEFNKVKANNRQREFVEWVKILAELKNSLSHSLEEVSSTRRDVVAQGDAVACTIQSSFEELHMILEQRKQQLLQEAKQRVNEKLENLNGQERSLSVAVADVHTVLDFTNRFMSYSSDDELMNMYIEIKRCVTKELEAHGMPGSRRWELAETADIGVKVDLIKTLHDLCLEAKITHISECIVAEVPNTARVGEKVKINVINKIKKPTLNIECEIQNLCTGSVCKPNIEISNSGNQVISYTPTARGRHVLSIGAFDKSVPGSPFAMTVHMFPVQLKDPLRVWENVTGPYSIAVNSVGEVIVAGSKDIFIFNSKGRRLRGIKSSRHSVKRVRSIDVDCEENIYFVGQSSAIGKSDRDCNNLDIYYMQQFRGPGYIDIAVVGNEIMVTERNNEGQIIVYDRNLKYVRQISCKNRAMIRHVHPDCHGNSYVSVDRNVHVINTMGDILYSFVSAEHGVRMLKNPWMVRVSGQYVYVSDEELYKTVVFTTKGKYVASLNGSGGCCVDQDGLIYIGDFNDNKIFCY